MQSLLDISDDSRAYWLLATALASCGAAGLLAARRQLHRAGGRYRAARWLACATIFLGAAMTLEVFLQIKRTKGEAYQRALHECAADRSAAMDRTLGDILGKLESLCRYDAGSASVERDEFAMFEKPCPGKRPPIRLTAWLPRVRGDERAAVEATARREGLADYRFTERGANGAIAAAPQRDAYCPIFYAEPAPPDWRGFGLDLMCDPVYDQAMRLACDTGAPAATPLVAPDGTLLDENGILMFTPVYRQFPPPESFQARRELLKGYYVVACPIREIVASALAQFRTDDLAVDLEDADSAAGGPSLYRYVPPGENGCVIVPSGPVEATTFAVGGRLWRLHFHPTEAFLTHHWSWAHAWILPIGLVAALCLGGTLFLVTTARARAETEILLRTAELRSEKDRLAASEARMQLHFERMPVACIVWDAEGRIQSWNPAAERMFGYQAAEALGKTAADLFPNAPGAGLPPSSDAITDRAATDTIANRAATDTVTNRAATATIADRAAPRHPVACMTRDRRMIWCEWVNTPLFDASGQPLGAISMIQDVTAQEAFQRAQCDAREAAEAAARAQAEFLANMSHEIRTPISAMLGYTELLLEEERSPEQAAHLNVVKRNGEHLLKVINDILDLSKAEAGKVIVERIACSPAEILADVETLMHVPVAAKNLKLTVVCTPEVPAKVLTDPLRLRQILMNLIGNAVKFTESGEICVSMHIEDGPPTALVCDVTDTGIGMTLAQTRGLFRPFRQADASTTRRYGGSGLGLTISQKLAEALGGSLCLAASVPGFGSRFRLTLPLAAIPADGPKANTATKDSRIAPAPATSLDCRILLAEDGPDNQRLISLLLRKAGAEVTVADNGRIAVDAALEAEAGGAPFELILMDMQMPVLDGYDATRELRRRGWTKPIVALTANAMAHDRDKCLSAGCDDYASKPIDRAALIARVREWTCESRAAAR